MNANKEIDRLAKYLMENFPNEIDKGDLVHNESAVDVAIQLLDRFKIIEDNFRKYQILEKNMIGKKYLKEK